MRRVAVRVSGEREKEKHAPRGYMEPLPGGDSNPDMDATSATASGRSGAAVESPPLISDVFCTFESVECVFSQHW